MGPSNLPGRVLRAGGIAWIAGPIAFVGATTIEALLLTANGYSYSFLTNTISNLGDPSLYPFPYYWMLNLSAIALGALILAGVPAFFAIQPRGGLGAIATALLVLSGIGAIGVGVFNEHLDYTVHISMATLAFVANGLVLLVVGIAAITDPGWRGWAVPSLVGAAVTTVALVFFASETSWLLGHGGWERLVVVGPIIWVIAAGVKMLQRSSNSGVRVASPTP